MSFRTLTCALAFTAAAGIALAGGHGGNPSVKARQSHMQLNAFNLGVLGAMAKGERDYDADAAATAAASLDAIANIDQSLYWADGTSVEDLGDETRALPAIWADMERFTEHQAKLREAMETLVSVAGNGQDGLGAALGEVGQTCGACHREFRKSDD